MVHSEDLLEGPRNFGRFEKERGALVCQAGSVHVEAGEALARRCAEMQDPGDVWVLTSQCIEEVARAFANVIDMKHVRPCSRHHALGLL